MKFLQRQTIQTIIHCMRNALGFLEGRNVVLIMAPLSSITFTSALSDRGLKRRGCVITQILWMQTALCSCIGGHIWRPVWCTLHISLQPTDLHQRYRETIPHVLHRQQSTNCLSVGSKWVFHNQCYFTHMQHLLVSLGTNMGSFQSLLSCEAAFLLSPGKWVISVLESRRHEEENIWNDTSKWYMNFRYSNI